MTRHSADRYAQLAEQQGRLWSRLVEKKPGHERAPAVAFSRLPGAGGEAVGHRVAEKLGYGFFGREIVDQVADELEVDHWVVEGLDERVRNGLERVLVNFFSRHPFREDDYLRGVTRVIRTLGHRGGVVLVGRGAPFLLPPEEALRVLLVAPREQRIARYAEVRGLPAERAEAELDRAADHRSDFAQRLFGVRQDDPTLYDLVLNTATLGFEGAADLVVAALRARFPG